MFIEYIAYQDKGNQLSYISKTRSGELLPQDRRNNPQTYLATAHRFGMEPCLVFPDIFRNPETDVIVYCQTKKDFECLTWDAMNLVPELGFKLEFYIFDTNLPASYSRCPLLRSIIQILTGLRLYLSEPVAGGSLGWLSESAKQWLDTLVMDLTRIGIKITGYRALDIPGKVRLSIAGCRAIDACHHLAMVRYILFRKQTANIKISLTNSIDPRDWSIDRVAGCSVTFSTKYMRSESQDVNENLIAIANNLDSTVCDCPDKFDSIFGVNRCETLVNGGPWWSYTAGLNTHGSSVNIKHRIGSPGYLIDIRPCSTFNPYKYASWIISQSKNYCKSPVLPRMLAITYRSHSILSPSHLRYERANLVERQRLDTGLKTQCLRYESCPTVDDNSQESPVSTVNEDTELNVIKCNESGNESESESEDDDEIEGLTIISHHESEPANRLASMARIKRRHTHSTSYFYKLTKWLS